MKIILFLLFVFVLPMMIGELIEIITKTKLKDIYSVLAFRFVVGNATQWAVFQLVAVPLIMAKVKFMTLVVCWCICIAVLLVFYVAIKRKTEKGSFCLAVDGSISDKLTMMFFALLATLLIAYQCYKYARYMHLDEDDSRFIVNAVDAYFNNTMMLTNPTTGEYMGTWVGDLAKDVASPWMMYVATIAKLSSIHPTIVAHTILPPFLLVASYCAYYLFATIIFKQDVLKSFMFLSVVAFTNMYFSDTVYMQTVFSLIRIWQGKATLAAVMIPFMLYALVKTYIEDESRNYIIIAISSVAMCLLSGMGIFFSGIMVGTYSCYFILIKRKWKYIPYAILCCIPTIVYGMVYSLIR